MQQSEKQQGKNQTQKVNFKDKNLDYLQKIKQRKQKQLEDKALQEKKQLQKRQNLRKKILEEVSKNRQNKESKLENAFEDYEIKGNLRRKTNFESLPKICGSDKEQLEEIKKRNYQERYVTFLQNLHKNNKSKKEIQEQEKKKKEQKYAKMKEQLGFNNIESKLTQFRAKDEEKERLPRTHSAEKFEQMIGTHQINKEKQQSSELPRTNKNFSKKNQEYIEKIKKRRQMEVQSKEQEKKKKEKLKDQLKDFVMNTVKKNVLDGVYDDEDLKKPKLKKQVSIKESKEMEENQSSESQKQKVQEVKKKRKMRAFPYIHDLSQWKKKNRIEQTDKVFIITGGYAEFKKSLKERGWYQNPDHNSPCFDMKYTLQSRQIDYEQLTDHQMANHFQKAGCITTKVGLTKSLKNLIWIRDLSEDNFYPKCFDLNDEDDYVGFQLHFKICKALSIIKIYCDFLKNQKKKEKQKGLIEDLKLRTEIAINVCKKNIEDVNEIIDRKKQIKIVTDKEWQILAQDELNEEDLAKKKHEEWLKSIDCKFQPTIKGKNKKIKKKKEEKSGEKCPEIIDDQEDEQNQELLQQSLAILQEYEKKFPQFHITGHNNIWILKPAGLSRGRGITCYNNLVQIQDHIKCKESQWIAQKYIENPLVILKRKFDIRQWVLVTDFNPLTIWIYEETYVRFSAIDYNAKQVSNKFIHLTNNAIGSKKSQNSHIKGNMFFQDEFIDYLQEKQGYDVFTEKIKPQIKEIVKYSLMCAVQSIQNRKNSHELYGYDLMVDENYKVWLIQINSSPSMDYSTHVTSKLVKECLQDIAKVVVDYHGAAKKDKKSIDTGNFKKIYKGIEVPQKPISTGLNLCLQGIPMKKPKRNALKVNNLSLDTKKSK